MPSVYLAGLELLGKGTDSIGKVYRENVAGV